MSEKFKLKNDTKDFTINLGREKIAELYANFINTLDGHHVIALDSPWGNGKSTLIDFICTNFETNKNVFIKYNAWENDYTEEPLISLMSDILTEFESKEYIGIDKMKNQISSIRKVGKKSITALLKGGAKILIGESASNDITEVFKEAGKIFIDDNSNDLFKDIDESKKSRKEFKEELKKYTNSILKEKNKDKLIIIIDELDRCRPTFAIELLENIKHLFDIENIIFLIAIDSKQLAESIKAVYGNGFDANTYLHRFFDFELHLKKDSIGDYFYNKIIDNLGIIRIDNLELFAKDTVKTFNLTIRDINKIVNEFYLLKKINDRQNPTFRIILEEKYLLFFLIIKVKNQELFKVFKQTKGNLTDKILNNVIDLDANLRLFMHAHFHYGVIFNDTNMIEKIEKVIQRIEETL